MKGKFYETAFSFIDNEFFGNQAVYGGAIYVNLATINIRIANNQFINNSALDGGAFHQSNLGFNLWGFLLNQIFRLGKLFQVSISHGNTKLFFLKKFSIQ